MVSQQLLEKIKAAVGVEQLTATGRGGGGCINQGEVYDTENGKIFLKRNDGEGAAVMFEGELASLQAIEKTGCIRVPKPYAVVVEDIKHGSVRRSTATGAVLVMEYLEMYSSGSAGEALGDQLADLHLHNLKLRDSPSASRVTSSVTSSGDDGAEEGGGAGEEGYESRFGFAVPTCCGYLPQNNTWCDDWQVLIARKLEEQLNRLQGKGRAGREALQLWPGLQRVLPTLFEGLPESPAPSLLHGDLWGGNAACITEGGSSRPVIFDPASLYGHHEYDLAIAGMFGGFGGGFWTAYFKRIPKQPGWDRRQQLYQLFHYLNHWNHFGSGYADSSLRIMRDLTA